MLLPYCLLPHLPQIPIHNPSSDFSEAIRKSKVTREWCASLSSLPHSTASLSPSTAPFRDIPSSSEELQEFSLPNNWGSKASQVDKDKEDSQGPSPTCSKQPDSESHLAQEFGWEVRSCQQLGMVKNQAWLSLRVLTEYIKFCGYNLQFVLRQCFSWALN